MSRRAAPAWRGSLSLLLTYAVALALVLLLAPPSVGTVSPTAGTIPPTAGTSSPAASPVPSTLPVGTALSTADADEVPVQVRLEAVTPAIASPGSGVLLTGTLRNAGPDPVHVHSVRVSTAYRGLDTRAAVQEWATTGDLETPTVLTEDHIGALLAPGAVVNFYANAPAEALTPEFDFATLPLRVEVTQDELLGPGWPERDQEARTEQEATSGQEARSGQDGSSEQGAAEPLPGTELRTFLPWHSVEAEAFNPIDIAWLAPVSLPGGPDLVDPDEATRASAWAQAIGPGSRNAALLEGLSGTGTTFMVDPAVLEPLDPVASLTEAVAAPGEEPTPSTPEPAPEPTSQPPSPTVDGAVSTSDDPGPEDTGTPPGQAGTTGAEGDGAPGPEDEGGTVGQGGDGLAPTTDPPATQAPPADGSDATATDGPDDPQQPVDPPTPPTTQEAVRVLGEQLAALPEEQLWWLPVGDTDTGALLELDQEVSTVAALVGRPLAQTPVASGRTDVAWPLTTTPDDDLIDRLRRVWTHAGGALGTKGVGHGTLSGAVLPASTISTAAHTGSAALTHPSGTTLLGYDERLSGIVASAGEPNRDGRSTQRLLAETLAIYQEQPAEDRSVMVAIPRTATVDASTLRQLVSTSQSTPWLRETTATQLLDAADPAPAGLTGAMTASGDLTAYSVPERSPLTADRISEIEEARTDLDGACEIVPGSEEACAAWLQALDRQYSARWRQGPDGWEEPVEHAFTVSREILEGLEINPTTINFFADEGVILITVTNELPLQIDNLRMTVRPGNARLRIMAQPEPITIGPESRATVQFRAKAIAAGTVPLNTTLSTPTGTQVGEVAETEVRVRPTGVWIYWLLGGVAGVILVLGLVRALRPRSAQPPAPPAAQDAAAAGSDLESP